MDDEFFEILTNWARLESRVFAAKDANEADALALELSSIEENILRLRPATSVGAMAQLRFAAIRLEKIGDDGTISGALRHVLNTLSRK